MIPEIGNFLLMLGLTVAFIQGVFPLVGASTSNLHLMLTGIYAGRVQFALILMAFLCLVVSFYSDDFSVLNVATNSNSSLPWFYKIAASWGSHEGSMLLWLFMLVGWTLAVSISGKQLPLELLSRVLGIIGLVTFGLLLFIIFTSNPFERMIPPPPDCADLNPLLQDPGMVIHPPMLYMGYVGCVVPYAFAVAALLGGRLDSTWARWSRPWTTYAWIFLTIGIMLGSWWAYYELGWGGWWFWDPVENASFMPWLSITALMHSLAVSEKRGGFKAWTVLLAILTFGLSLLGTFLVRSGVITSVHAFASDPARGIFILCFLALVIGCSLILFAVRAPKVGLGSYFALKSREGALMANNVLFLSSTAAVLLGTLYPLFIDAIGLGKISVGPPYFDLVFVALMAPAIFLMGIGPLANWKRSEIMNIVEKTRWIMVVALLAGLLVPVIYDTLDLYVGLGVFLAAWVISSTLLVFSERFMLLRGNTAFSMAQTLRSIPLGFYGMLIAHLGVAIFIVGVTFVSSYEEEKDLRLGISDVAEIGKYSFRLDGFKEERGPNYDSIIGQFSVFEDNEFLTVLRPEKRFYHVQQMPMTEASIDTGLFRDLYVSLGEQVSMDSWVVRVYLKPFVTWIWGGAIVMALGGLVAGFDRRFKVKARLNAKIQPNIS